MATAAEKAKEKAAEKIESAIESGDMATVIENAADMSVDQLKEASVKINEAQNGLHNLIKEKTREAERDLPFYKKTWFKQLVKVGAVVGVTSAVVGTAKAMTSSEDMGEAEAPSM